MKGFEPKIDYWKIFAGLFYACKHKEDMTGSTDQWPRAEIKIIFIFRYLRIRSMWLSAYTRTVRHTTAKGTHLKILASIACIIFALLDCRTQWMMSKEEVPIVTVFNENIPIYYSRHIISPEIVEKAIGSKPFSEWVNNVELSTCLLRSFYLSSLIAPPRA